MKKEMIPNGWEKATIGSLIKEEPKSKIQVGEAANFGEYPFFTSGDDVLQHTEALVDGEKIYMATGGCANVKYYNKKASYSTDTYVISTNEKINTKYLYYEIDRLNYYINANYFLGSGLKHLQKKDFKKHEIIFPTSIKEQEKIVSLLTKIDIAIEQTKSLIDKYANIKKGLMHDLFAYGIDEKGQIRSEKTHKFKDSPLGRIPVEWEVVKIKDLSNKGYLRTGPFGSSLKMEHWRESGIPVITIGSIGEHDFLLDKLLFIDEEKANDLSVYRMEKGDILFSRVADIGRSLVIKENNVGWVMSSNFMRLRINSSLILPDFLYTYIKNSEMFKKEVAEQTNASGRAVTNSSIVNSLDFLKLSIAEQKRILDRLQKTDAVIESENRTIANLQAQKQGLMSDLLTGKVLIKEEQKYDFK